MQRSKVSKEKRSDIGASVSSAGPSSLRVAPEELNKGIVAREPFGPGPLGRIQTLAIRHHDLTEGDAALFSMASYIEADTETDGLDFRRDRLRLVTLSDCHGNIRLVRNPDHRSNNLRFILQNKNLIFHHSSFDLKFLYWWCYIRPTTSSAVECTKTQSKIIRPKQSSSLYKVIPEVLGVEAYKDKNITLSDWNVKKLSAEQITYACTDVIHLSDLFVKMGRKILEKGRYASYRTAAMAIALIAEAEVEGYGDTLSYDGQPNEKLRQLWEKRRKVMTV